MRLLFTGLFVPGQSGFLTLLSFILIICFSSVTLLTPAIAWAKRVLPHPGGPWRRKPLGGVTPRVRNTSGCFIWTSSLQTCSTVSSQPPMSENLTDDCAGSKSTKSNDQKRTIKKLRIFHILQAGFLSAVIQVSQSLARKGNWRLCHHTTLI